MLKLVFATNNQNKIDELNSLLLASIELLKLKDIKCFEEIPENASTIKLNAIQKARYVYEKYGYNCFADDTGLEIDALNGAPGVLSARYAGENRINNNNIAKVLSNMANKTKRTARFKTVIALIIDGKITCFEGIILGEITNSEQGNYGFGYDSIFMPLGKSITFAEMPLSEKNKISHRSIAFNKLIDYLKKNYKL